MTQTTQTAKVGARQFRDNFANYIGNSDQPIAITRHGDTVGYYVPARPRRSDDEKVALKQAVDFTLSTNFAIYKCMSIVNILRLVNKNSKVRAFLRR